MLARRASCERSRGPGCRAAFAAQRSTFADEVFTPLGRTDLPCGQLPDPSATAPLPDQFLVILNDAAQLDPTTLPPSLTVVRQYDSLPLIEVNGPVESLAGVEALPAVMKVLPSLGCAEQSRGFAIGFNALTRIARLHRTMPSHGFGGIERGSGAGYPVVRGHGETMTVVTDHAIDWPAPPAILPVVNLSVGPKSASFPFLANDVVNVASFAAAREMLVVVAAGNCGQAGERTMSPWASAEWVLSVGATSDADGQALAPYSSRGSADDPDSGPDVVAWGTIHDPHEHMGTSFAAPRVSGMARLVCAALTQLGREVRVAAGAAPYGLPLVGFALIDAYGAEIWQRGSRLIAMPALPVLGVVRGAAGRLVELCGAGLNVTATTSLLREIIVSAATPVSGYGPHEVGAGFVDDRRVLDRLARVTGADVVRWFGGAGAPTVPELDRLIVFDRAALEDLNRIVRATGPAFMYDYRAQRMGLAPYPEDEFAALPLDQRINGFELT